ncbi:DUF4190 domain-containing protein [Streptomyces sp. NPDC041068]|uniref:DUF4190 domain-containing protein n=1 Tax=Streptomyces sp. NPDC041068 TaxID=3155130 RepID=UPI0033E305A8
MDIPPSPGPHEPPPGQPGQPGQQAQPGQLPSYPHPGQAPYQQWPGPYSPFSRPPVNGFAIASLVLGILCCIPGLGLIFGLVGLSQIKKKGERGKGLAIAGSILSVVGVLLLVLAVATGGARDFVDGFKEAARESRQNAGAFPVDKGGCFDAPNGKIDSMKYGFQVEEVRCSGRHDGEVFGSFRVNHTSYPGDDELTELADTKCAALTESYIQDTWAVPGDADIYYFVPDRDTWRRGDRHITCLFGANDPEEPLKGSLRRDASTLDDDQLAYVKADKAFEEAHASAPEEERFEDDLEGHKKWAARVDKGMAERVRQLRAHDWSAETQGHIDGLVAEIGKARKEWAKAAEAPDADRFYDHYTRGFGLLDGKSEFAARKSLGLATTSPRDATPEDGPESGLGEGHGEDHGEDYGEDHDDGGEGAAV